MCGSMLSLRSPHIYVFNGFYTNNKICVYDGILLSAIFFSVSNGVKQGGVSITHFLQSLLGSTFS